MKQTLKRELKIYEKERSNRVVPEIRIVGLWLQELGFNVGDKYTVELVEGKLIIEKVPVIIEEVKPTKRKRKNK